jgi:cAMP-dependent protein kinase regulator
VGAIGEAFGLGSTRRSASAAPLPPPLLPNELAPHFAALSGAALLEAAEKAAARLGAPTPARAGARNQVPELPLFGALSPPGLTRLLSCFTLRELPTGAAVVTQGAAGSEAFVVVRGRCEAQRQHDGPSAGSTALATLGAGAVFGEMALVSAAPRAASVIAIEPVLLLVAERSALEAVALDEPAIGRALSAFCEERMLANLLRHSPMLSSVPPQERVALLARLERRSLARGDALVSQGHDSDGVYLIASGQVQVRKHEEGGEELVLAQLGAGDVVGEISLVLRRPASADVLALSPTIALLLRREVFQEVVHEHPTLLRELYDLAVERDEETRSVVAQQALDASDLVIV